MCDQQRLRPACSLIRAFADKSLCYSMCVKLLTENHLEFLSLIGGCIGSSESTLVKMPHCWKSHDTAQICWPGWVEAQSCQYLFCGMQQLHFLLTTKILCFADYWLLAVECLRMIKLKKNKTIKSVLVRTESTRRYNQNIFIFAIKVILFKWWKWTIIKGLL